MPGEAAVNHRLVGQPAALGSSEDVKSSSDAISWSECRHNFKVPLHPWRGENIVLCKKIYYAHTNENMDGFPFNFVVRKSLSNYDSKSKAR